MMSAQKQNRRVSDPPPKPLMVFDGDCRFCRLWIERWREVTAGRVEYEPLQEAASKFPEIPRADFERAVHLIEPNGRALSGAEAVYHSLGYGRGRGWLRWSYDHLPGFAAISELLYAFIARHRELAFIVTNLLWGSNVQRPRYENACRWFFRLLGTIYLVAFISFWVQADGLVGTGGILPVQNYLQAAHQQIGAQACFALPTLCWFNSSNGFLHLLCGGGSVCALLLMAGIAPVASLILLSVFYLSLTIAGQTFFSFQWDILLLETGFLAIFLAPFRWRWRRRDPVPVSRGALFLLHFLLFKLMLMSGVVKLTSGDSSWWNLTALDFHYWTQPLPTAIGWWAAQHAEWFKKLSTFFVLAVEVAAPFLIWMPRRLRLFGAGALVLLQILIALTGNYCFFNLLTIALCLLLIDDAVWPGCREQATAASSGRNWLVAVVIALTLPVNAMLLYSGFRPSVRWPRAMETMYGLMEPFRIVNGYGLFRVMTKERPEIVIEGSADGVTWQPYEFKWKPGAVGGMPAFVAPYQPRLDWQMWFAALGDFRQNPWFLNLLVRLLDHTPETLNLLGKNPFPDEPPNVVRATLYYYHFTSADERARTGAWWKREEVGPYCPPVSLRKK